MNPLITILISALLILASIPIAIRVYANLWAIKTTILLKWYIAKTLWKQDKLTLKDKIEMIWRCCL